MVAATNSGVRCSLHIQTVNGIKAIWHGRHPTAIHELCLREAGLPITCTYDEQEQRMHMAELPLVDESGLVLCGGKQNNPPNEICLQRLDRDGDHVSGRSACFTVTDFVRSLPKFAP